MHLVLISIDFDDFTFTMSVLVSVEKIYQTNGLVITNVTIILKKDDKAFQFLEHISIKQ